MTHHYSLQHCLCHFLTFDSQKQRFSSFENNTGLTYGRKDTTYYRDAMTHLKIKEARKKERKKEKERKESNNKRKEKGRDGMIE